MFSFRSVRLLLLVVAGILVCVVARAEYFVIRSYHVEVTFTEQGHALFDETIQVEFTQPRHGIFRHIPVRSIIDGRRVDRIIEDVEVEGFKFSTSKKNHNLVLKIGDPDVYVSGRQVYRLRYRILNPVNVFKEHTEFYWDLLGISWPVMTEVFTFRVVFPGDIGLMQDDVYCYTGKSGSLGQDVEFQVYSSEVTGKSTRRLMPEEAVTLAVRLPQSAFPPMDAWTYFLKRHGLLLAAFFFLLSGGLAMYFARNKRETIMTEFFPPEGISPAIAGGFVDHSVDHTDVLCLIPYLAGKGYLRLEADESKGLLKRGNITFIKLKDADGEMMAFERTFFNGLFASGGHVELNSLKDKFYTTLASVRTAIRKWIKDQGWYAPDQKAMGCVTALGGLGALGWGAYAIFGRENLDGIALIVAGVILFVLSGKFNKRTPDGNATFRKLEGFRQFVDKAERPVIERLMKEDPLYYDKTMPYALAFGFLKKWNKHFEGLLTQPPSWYSGPHGYAGDMTHSWTTFSTNFPSEINRIGSVFSSAPSSSGSGGGGGGSSGGGSGGGGGGSW